MAIEAPKAADMFDGASPVEAAERFEEYQATLNKSLANGVTTPGQAPVADPLAAMEQLAISKSLSADASASLQNALTAQRLAMQDIQKDITHSAHLSRHLTSKHLLSCSLHAQPHSVTESLARRV
jgi:hypothetical protein